jgi:hypothetical protein
VRPPSLAGSAAGRASKVPGLAWPSRRPHVGASTRPGFIAGPAPYSTSSRHPAEVVVASAACSAGSEHEPGERTSGVGGQLGSPPGARAPAGSPRREAGRPEVDDLVAGKSSARSQPAGRSWVSGRCRRHLEPGCIADRAKHDHVGHCAHEFPLRPAADGPGLCCIGGTRRTALIGRRSGWRTTTCSAGGDGRQNQGQEPAFEAAGGDGLGLKQAL